MTAGAVTRVASVRGPAGVASKSYEAAVRITALFRRRLSSTPELDRGQRDSGRKTGHYRRRRARVT
jgi:hypothetical protein